MRNHSVTVIIQTKTKEELAPNSAVAQNTQFEITNPEMNDEQIHAMVANIIEQMDPSATLPDGIITETQS